MYAFLCVDKALDDETVTLMSQKAVKAQMDVISRGQFIGAVDLANVHTGDVEGCQRAWEM